MVPAEPIPDSAKPDLEGRCECIKRGCECILGGCEGVTTQNKRIKSDSYIFIIRVGIGS